MNSSPLKISLTLGPGVDRPGNYVYVWLNASGHPFYVGETSQTVADRTGLHIRDKTRSGAVVAKILSKSRTEEQRLTVLAFSIPDDVIRSVARDNNAPHDSASANRSRKAIERAVYEQLSSRYSGMHIARGCKWKAPSADSFIAEVVQACIEK